jgi:flagellar biosynthesis protein FlhF
MKLKSYFSGTVEGAMVLARREMGDEAMLVNARPASPEMRYLGAYEVVFGVAPVDGPPETRSIAAPAPPAPALNASAAEPPQTRDWLARQMESLQEEILRVSASLREREAKAVAQEAPDTGFTVEPTVGVTGAKRALAALVGPAGCGKTTTIAKLAARCGLAGRKSTHILSTDVFRIGAAEQMRTIGGLLDVGFDLARDTGHMDRLAALHADKDLVLVDTPGLSFAEMDDARGFIEWIARHAEMDTHLVLPASMDLADMERIASEYQCFAPKKLLFTHLDETGDCRRMLSLSARTGLPISFLTQGQRIPDDIELSTRDGLMELATKTQLRKGAAA